MRSVDEVLAVLTKCRHLLSTAKNYRNQCVARSVDMLTQTRTLISAPLYRKNKTLYSVYTSTLLFFFKLNKALCVGRQCRHCLHF